MFICGTGIAQTYPLKPVRIVNPFSAGGSLDLVGRMVAKSMSEELGHQVIVENRPGGGGTPGIEFVSRLPADGYALLVTGGSFTINTILRPNVATYNPVSDFSPIAKLTSYMYFLVAHPTLPVRSVKELIALAKAKPGQINYASVGMGTGTHLSAELFNHMAGVKMLHIPYKGTGQVMPDLLGGYVALLFGSTNVVPHVKSRKLIALGVTGAKRASVLPDIPTIEESGLAGYEMSSWHALLAPAGVPVPIVSRVNELARKALTHPGAKVVLDPQGLEADVGTPAELGALIKSDVKKWGTVIKYAGIKAQ